MRKKLIQQGDVLMFTEEALPEGAKTIAPKARGYVLAEGEATGHAHVIVPTPEIEMYEDSKGVLWLKTGTPTEVRHEEHNTVTLEPGIYRVGIVKEVDPFENEIHDVMD